MKMRKKGGKNGWMKKLRRRKIDAFRILEKIENVKERKKSNIQSIELLTHKSQILF
jgi:hypothetical protein